MNLMYRKLPFELDQALRLISAKVPVGLLLSYIQKLLAAGYITYELRDGWMVNDKGKQYLKKNWEA